jgi:tellurite resistance protein TerC
MESLISKGIKQVKRIVIAVIGFTVLLIGIAMIILPGPAFVVIPIGLGILATEFLWARKLLKEVKKRLQKAKGGNIYGEKTK